MRTNFFWRSAAVVVAAIAMLTIQTRTVSAQEDKFKAIFIYNFTKQIEWPASESNGDFVICVVNQDDVFEQVKSLAQGKLVNDKTISVIGVKNINDIPDCQILYLPSSESIAGIISSAVAKVGSAATLIVSDKPGALEYGSCINFVMVDYKIKYEINKKAIEDRNMKVLNSMAVNATNYK